MSDVGANKQLSIAQLKYEIANFKKNIAHGEVRKLTIVDELAKIVENEQSYLQQIEEKLEAINQIEAQLGDNKNG